ncbi:MAG: Ig-like domain-containing protein, partial [bacterium]
SYLLGTSTPFGTIDTIGVSSGGEAIVNLRSATRIGKAEVIASVLGLSDTINIDFVPGRVARIQLEAEPDSIPADGASQLLLTATLYDENSNPIGVGNLVTFTTTSGSLEFTNLYT